MNTITVDELYKALAQARKSGLGSKKILLSNDDEGNGYHECFFTVSKCTEDFLFPGALPYGVSDEEAVNEYVIVG